MNAYRLAELATLDPGDEFADDARVPITIRDLRDLVALVPVVEAAINFDDDYDKETGEKLSRLEDAIRNLERPSP